MYTQLSTVVLVSWCLLPIVWVFGIGAKALSGDVDIGINALLDLATVGCFATTLVKGGKLLGPGLARDKSRRAVAGTGYEAPDSDGAPHFSGPGILGDDLGDLEDGL